MFSCISITVNYALLVYKNEQNLILFATFCNMLYKYIALINFCCVHGKITYCFYVELIKCETLADWGTWLALHKRWAVYDMDFSCWWFTQRCTGFVFYISCYYTYFVKTTTHVLISTFIIWYKQESDWRLKKCRIFTFITLFV